MIAIIIVVGVIFFALYSLIKLEDCYQAKWIDQIIKENRIKKCRKD